MSDKRSPSFGGCQAIESSNGLILTVPCSDEHVSLLHLVQRTIILLSHLFSRTLPAKMSKYTSTKEGFQEAMQWSLTGPSEETKDYVQATTTSSFYHVMNGQRFEAETYTKSIEEWRSKVSDYKPVV